MRSTLIGLPIFLSMSKTPVTFVSLSPVTVAIAASHAVGHIVGVRACTASFVRPDVATISASVMGY